MDQINQLMTDFGFAWPKFIAQIILFLILYFLLNKLAFAPVLKMLEERRRKIEEGQVNAEKIRKQLAETELRYQEVLRKANDEAQHLLAEAHKMAEANKERQAQLAIKQAAEIIQNAQVTITQERNKMVAEVKKEMLDLVVDTTAKVTGKVLTPEDQKRLSDSTLKELVA